MVPASRTSPTCLSRARGRCGRRDPQTRLRSSQSHTRGLILAGQNRIETAGTALLQRRCRGLCCAQMNVAATNVIARGREIQKLTWRRNCWSENPNLLLRTILFSRKDAPACGLLELDGLQPLHTRCASQWGRPCTRELWHQSIELCIPVLVLTKTNRGSCWAFTLRVQVGTPLRSYVSKNNVYRVDLVHPPNWRNLRFM